MEKTIVRVENLSHRYGGSQWAIRNINFEINEKGVLGLLGSNGAGKSTTMNIICGVLNQTSGNVYISNIDVRLHPTEAKKYLGFYLRSRHSILTLPSMNILAIAQHFAPFQRSP